MATKTGSNDGGPESGVPLPPRAARIYCSRQEMRQIRFSSRRRVVKRYGRHETARSPRQQTLTQAGYAISPLPGLREDAPDIRPIESEPIDVRSESPLTIQTSSPGAEKGSRKRRKIRHQVWKPTATSSFHTQTLTQFVSKHVASEIGDWDDDDSSHTIIRDSKDEEIFASPITRSKGPVTPQKNKTKTLPMWKGEVGFHRMSPKCLVSTPSAYETEIPSSQPSPFTPISHSPMDRQQSGGSSPLYNKRATRSAHQDNRRSTTAAVLEKDLYNGTTEKSPVINAGSDSLVKGSQTMCTSEEIPDSDEEDISFSCHSCPSQRGASLASLDEAAESLRGSPANDATSSPISPPPTLPLTLLPVTSPTSPTPLPRQRHAVAAEVAVPLPRTESRVSTEAGRSQDSNRGSRALDCFKSDSTSRREKDQPRELYQQHEVISASTSCHINQCPDSESPYSHDAQTQYSQFLESQRVSLEVLRTLGPQTDRSDIIISIHPEQMQKIANGTKDHDFRNFKIPHTVSRFWIYATRPVCELQYMAVVAPGFRQPGEIDNDSGIGNADFNAGRLVAKYAYKLVQVYQLNNPVTLNTMREKGWAGPPRRYDYLPPAVVGSLLGNLRCALFEDLSDQHPSPPNFGESLINDNSSKAVTFVEKSAAGSNVTELGDHDSAGGSQHLTASGEMSVSQEVEAQLLSDNLETHTPRTLQSPVLLDNQAQASRLVAPSSMFGIVWPSQSTTDIVPTTQEMLRDSKVQLHESEFKQDSDLLAVPRPKLDLEQSKADFAEIVLCGKRSPCDADRRSQRQESLPGTHKIASARRQRLLLQTNSSLLNESTQVALPDSLYEEVRQAPPAVILDSEDSDDEG